VRVSRVSSSSSTVSSSGKQRYNRGPMAEKDKLVQVEIFGQSYAVRGGNDPAYVEKLASYVDEQMKGVSGTSGAVDSLRIAVLAALNIADERFRLAEELEGAAARERSADLVADERAARLAKQLAAALGE
jgi:cell division protein ZapA